MTTWTHRALILPDAITPSCRALAAQVLGEAPASGMWITGLSPTGAAPATHWISVGLIWESFAEMLSSPEALSEGAGISIAQAEVILGMADISEDAPADALARLGLQLVQESEDAV